MSERYNYPLGLTGAHLFEVGTARSCSAKEDCVPSWAANFGLKFSTKLLLSIHFTKFLKSLQAFKKLFFTTAFDYR